jgi:hypothetical protein
MPWKPVKDFKAEVKVGDKLQNPKHYQETHPRDCNGCCDGGKVTAIGEEYFLLKDKREQREFRKLIEYEGWQKWHEPKRWVPKENETYYNVGRNSDMSVCQTTFLTAFLPDAERIEIGNCFRTVAQALEAARRIKEVLSKYQDELMEVENG